MTLRYYRFDNGRVSRPWLRLLRDLRRDGVDFHLNSGHRTMAEQRALVAKVGIWSQTNLHGAAKPSPNAPHIRTGRMGHACDFDHAANVEIGAASKGVTLTANVPGESWHLDPNAAELRRYWRKRRRAIRRRRRRLLAKRTAAKLRRRPTRMTDIGLDMVRAAEGLRLVAYKPVRSDPWTIGYGHTSGVREGDRITKEQAETFLHEDVRSSENAVLERVPAGMRSNRNEFDALADAAFNLGPGIFDKGRTMGDALRSGSKSRVALAFLVYVKDGAGNTLPGLVKRRRAESELYVRKP